MPSQDSQILRQHTAHPRTFRANRFVYPVLSRRSRGLSLGINLNPDKICNFDCIYCQVNRRSDSETRFVELDALLTELQFLVEDCASGRLYDDEQFIGVPQELRRLNDFAFSGDGEPTTHRNFPEIVDAVARVRREHGLNDTKIVLITNASMFDRASVKRGLATLDANNGEIWAKLDAGTAEYYHQIERTPIPFARILTNLVNAAIDRPLVIQSLFMRVQGHGPAASEIDAYVGRLRDILRAGGQLSRVQVYTVARRPAESHVSSLPIDSLRQIARQVGSQTGIPTEIFGGADAG